MLVRVVGRSNAPVRDYRSDQRDGQARLTRRRVIDAGTAVFLERGYAAATMRAIAAKADVAVPTVELLFGKKSRLLKEAIDVARVGDDEPVAVLDRDWTAAATAATSAAELLSIVARVLAPAHVRSAGLVLAVFEGAAADAELAALAAQLVEQRARTAEWLVDQLRRVGPLRTGSTRQEAIDTVWILIDPAVFDRLIRQRHWTAERYERWIADSIARLLVDSATHLPSKPQKRRTR
jgi:AcrR family transcriptional regulator